MFSPQLGYFDGTIYQRHYLFTDAADLIAKYQGQRLVGVWAKGV